MRLSAGFAAAFCAGCASARLAGGAQIAPGTEPTGSVVARYTIGRCEDSYGTRIPEPESHISVVRIPDGRLVLVERRPGYDSLVIDNGWTERELHVFQLAFKRSTGGPYLREYRMPVQGTGFGRFAVVKAVQDWGDSAKGFHARYSKAALACELAPVG
jgi:hypothetical protein